MRRPRATGGARAIALAAAAAAAFVLPGPARAWDAEWTANLELGGGVDVDDGGEARNGRFVLGLHSDVMLFRGFSRDVGFGFTLDVESRGFDDLLATGGVGVLLPIHESFPFVLSGGAGVDALTGDGVWFARLWWGARNHNQSSPFSSTFGVFAEYDRAITGDEAPSVLVGVSIDAWTLLWPFLLAYEALAVDQPPEVL